MTLDLSSLFHTSIGFDHLYKMLEEATNTAASSNYPPYNIIKINELHYRISLAVAGFDKNELEITLYNTLLKIKSVLCKDTKEIHFLYKGIATRSFEKKFQLAENIKIKNVFLDKGLLNIDLLKTNPEPKQPQRIEIK